MVAQTVTNHFLKECNENFQMHICKLLYLFVICKFFLAEVSTKLKKCTFLDNLLIITQEVNMKTRQMTSFFSSTFSTATVCTFIFVFEKSQNLFSCGPFWSIKYLNFGQKLPIWTTHHDK